MSSWYQKSYHVLTKDLYECMISFMHVMSGYSALYGPMFSTYVCVVGLCRMVLMFLNLMDVVDSMFSLSFLIYNVSDLLV